MKKYIGRRTENGAEVRIEVHPEVTETSTAASLLAKVRLLPVRLDVCNHSPNGFEWGYPGSGPAQLALAILCDYYGNNAEASRKALVNHQSFKVATVANIEANEWEMTETQVRDVLAKLTAHGRAQE